MKKNWLLIALLLSVVINLGVLISLVRHWHQTNNINERGDTNTPADSTMISAQEWQEASRLLFKTREKSRPLIESSVLARRKFMKSISDKDFNKAETTKALKEFLTARNAMEESLGKGLIEVRSGMRDSLAAVFFANRFRQKGLSRERIAERWERQPANRDSLLMGRDQRPREIVKDRIKERIRKRRQALRNKDL